MSGDVDGDGAGEPQRGAGGWTFLSNHAHVLVCLDRNPDRTMRDVAAEVGITLRAVQAIVADLTREGYLTVTRNGRRNHYSVDHARPLRHPVEAGSTVGAVLDVVTPRPRAAHAAERDGTVAAASTAAPVTAASATSAGG